MLAMIASKQRIQIASWNIAAINNNPFEYWITYDEDENYEKIMSNVEEFLERPGVKDVAVSEVFTEKMFDELEKRMLGVGWDSVRSYWENDFRDRKIVSGFMKARRLCEDCSFLIIISTTNLMRSWKILSIPSFSSGLGPSAGK